MNIEIQEVLEALDIDFDIKGNEANGLCPMHKERTGKEDRSPSWWVNLTTGQHTCFSCHYKGGLLHLVCDVKHFYTKSWGDIYEPDYSAAKLWLATITEVTPESLAERLRRIPSRVTELPRPVPMSEARLAVFDQPPASALIARNISPGAAKYYGILWDTKTSAWILPLRDADGKLMGWQEKGTVNRTFMNRPGGLAKSKTLFGLAQMKDTVVYVVESPLDCARIHSAGYPGAVAICGSTISEPQIKFLRNAGRVIAAFDNPKLDPAGKRASDSIRNLSVKYGINLLFFNYGDTGKKDPGDLTDEEIGWGIEHAQSALYGERSYV
jgi:hypothetical protein